MTCGSTIQRLSGNLHTGKQPVSGEQDRCWSALHLSLANGCIPRSLERRVLLRLPALFWHTRGFVVRNGRAQHMLMVYWRLTFFLRLSFSTTFFATIRRSGVDAFPSILGESFARALACFIFP